MTFNDRALRALQFLGAVLIAANALAAVSGVPGAWFGLLMACVGTGIFTLLLRKTGGGSS